MKKIFSNLIFLVCLLFDTSFSYVATIKSRTSPKLFSNPGSYEQMLQQARLKKQQETKKVEYNQPRPIAKVAPVKEAPPAPTNAKKSTGGLPFDDETYSHIAYVLQKFSVRLRSDKPLTLEELQKLRIGVNAIISDANPNSIDNTVSGMKVLNDKQKSIKSANLTPSGKPQVTSTRQQPPTNQPSGSFDQFNGLKSTWDVPGLEKLTVDEYYSALNKRIATVRDDLKSNNLIGPKSGDYIESLNRKQK